MSTITSYLWLLLFAIPASHEKFLETLSEFNVNNGSFSSYSDRLNMYYKIHNVTDDLKLPMMILLMGDNAYEVLVNLAAPKHPTVLTYEEATELLKRHLRPTLPVLTGPSCYQFRLKTQKEDENINQYVQELQKLSGDCNFGTVLGTNLRDQFVNGLKSNVIKQKLFKEDDRLTFVEAVKIATSLEEADNKTESKPVEFVDTKDTQDKLQEICPGYLTGTPITCPVHNGVFPGRVFKIRGSTKPDAARFSINLQCGEGAFVVDRANDLAIHIDFRFTQDVLVRNTMIAARPPLPERWFDEARSTIPMKRGKPFEATIVCEESSFKININGTQLADYPYQLPIHRATHLLFLGDIIVQSVAIESTKDSEENSIQMHDGLLNSTN